MLSNHLAKVISMIPLFDRSGTQSITHVEDARRLVQTIPEADRKNPATTYQDAQCGTALDALVLAEQLYKDLEECIPDGEQRLKHMFTNQIYLSDVDPVQARIAKANIKRALNNNQFEPCVQVKDCFTNQHKTNYTFGSIDFATTNEFVERYLELSDHVLVITKSNKNRYVDNRLSSLASYEFLRRVNNTPMCLIHVPKNKTNTVVRFTDGQKHVHVDNPRLVPTEDFQGWQYANAVIGLGLPGYIGETGPERPRVIHSVGSVPVVFNPGRGKIDCGIMISQDRQNGHVIGISEQDITADMGYGIPKLLVSKNGNPNQIPNLYWDDGSVCASGQVTWIAMTKDEFDKLAHAIKNESCYNVLFKSVLIKTHTKEFWSRIPQIEYFEQVKTIYDNFYK